MKALWAIPILMVCLVSSQTQAEELNTDGLINCGTVQAGEAIGGARFKDQTGQVIKLALVKAPELWSADAPYKSWPYAREARDALEKVVTGVEVQLFCEGPDRKNRFDELVAHVIMPDGSWLQHRLVSEGHIFVFPRPTRRRGLDRLFKAEDTARDLKAGLWALKNLQTIDAVSGDIRTGWFHIIEGTVLKAEQVGTTLYLNFGEDWRRDFTVEIPSSALRHFKKINQDPINFGGQRVEVRGWIDYKAGPRLLLQGPGQIRVVTQATVTDNAPQSQP